MPRDFIPVEQRSTRNLELAFDRLTSNKLVADAIEVQMDSLWNRMSGAERRSVLGTGGQEKRAAA